MGGVLPLCPQRTSKYVTKFSNHDDGVGWGGVSMFCPQRTSKYVTSFSNHVHGVDHTKSVAVSVRTLLAVALHQYVQRHVEDYSKSCTASVAWLNRANFDWQGWGNDSQALVAASVFGLAKQKSFISTARNDFKKRTPWNCHKKEPKKTKCSETSRLMHFEVIHKCQRR